MGKLVYLFELDSVRKTDEEIYKGQLAMYDELLGNGNTIVMSMNQVADSKVFLCMLQDKENYNIVKKLLKQGHIRISRYGNVRTISQYVQNAINKDLEKGKGGFIFSAIPVKSNQKRLLKLMQQVLTNSDLSIIKEYIDSDKNDKDIVKLFDEYKYDETDKEDIIGIDKENTVNIDKAKEYLEFLYRFLELIIIGSMYEESVTPPIKCDKNNFSNIIKKVLSFKVDNEIWGEGINILGEIGSKLDDSEQNDRSTWIKQINKLYKKEDNKKNDKSLQYSLAELIIDLCYNYAIERSIYGVSKHFEENYDSDSFKKEFFLRLKCEWNYVEKATKRFLQEETNDYKPYTGKLPNWKLGMRILSRRKNTEIDFNENRNIPLYEYCYEQQRERQKKEDIFNILKGLLTVFLNVVILYFVNDGTSNLQNYINPVLESVITFLILAILNDVISKAFNLPNILECIQILGNSIEDFLKIISREPATYVNDNNFNNNYVEEAPKILDSKIKKSKALEEYIDLFKKIPAVFKNEENTINIVEPDEDGIKEIIEYEATYNKEIGVVYKSDYNMMVVDLIKDAKGKYSTYERLIPTVPKGAVVIIPVYKGKFVLLNQFRHAMRCEQLAFPRGYGEIDKDRQEISSESNAIKELKEELGATINDKPQKLGEVIADSGISGNKVMVYMVNITLYKEKSGYEGIKNVELKTEEELKLAIKNGEINDGYTLSAYTLYVNNSKKYLVCI